MSSPAESLDSFGLDGISTLGTQQFVLVVGATWGGNAAEHVRFDNIVEHVTTDLLSQSSSPQHRSRTLGREHPVPQVTRSHSWGYKDVELSKPEWRQAWERGRIYIASTRKIYHAIANKCQSNIAKSHLESLSTLCVKMQYQLDRYEMFAMVLHKVEHEEYYPENGSAAYVDFMKSIWLRLTHNGNYTMKLRTIYVI